MSSRFKGEISTNKRLFPDSRDFDSSSSKYFAFDSRFILFLVLIPKNLVIA
jgi:hypothetical protein